MDYAANKSINQLIADTYIFYREKRDEVNNYDGKLPKELRSYKKYKDMTNEDLQNEAIRDSFQIKRHWIDYKVPKWINVMNNLQKYVCEKNNLKPSNYSFFASQIESGFIPEKLAYLSECGIPVSAIRKIEKEVPDDIRESKLFLYLKSNKIEEMKNLLKYEKEKIIDNY